MPAQLLLDILLTGTVLVTMMLMVHVGLVGGCTLQLVLARQVCAG